MHRSSHRVCHGLWHRHAAGQRATGVPRSGRVHLRFRPIRAYRRRTAARPNIAGPERAGRARRSRESVQYRCPCAAARRRREPDLLGLRLLQWPLVLVFRRAAGRAAVHAVSIADRPHAVQRRRRAAAHAARHTVPGIACHPRHRPHRAENIAGRHIHRPYHHAVGVERRLPAVPPQLLFGAVRRVPRVERIGNLAVAWGGMQKRQR